MLEPSWAVKEALRFAVNAGLPIAGLSVKLLRYDGVFAGPFVSSWLRGEIVTTEADWDLYQSPDDFRKMLKSWVRTLPGAEMLWYLPLARGYGYPPTNHDF